MILTDSSGVQEEATALGVPVLVLRNTTERSEGVDAGILKLIGTDSDRVYSSVKLLLEDKLEYERMSKVEGLYGDGYASEKILNTIFEVINN